jgi:hypothetical protein
MQQLNAQEAISAINVGMVVQQRYMLGDQALRDANTYLAAGYCQQLVDRGREALKGLSTRDRQSIKSFVKQLYNAEDNEAMLTVDKGMVIQLSHDQNKRKLTLNDGRLIAEIMNSGYDAPVEIVLADGFSVIGETVVSHAKVDGHLHPLIKKWGPVEIITSAIGLLVSGQWSKS